MFKPIKVDNEPNTFCEKILFETFIISSNKYRMLF